MSSSDGGDGGGGEWQILLGAGKISLRSISRAWLAARVVFRDIFGHAANHARPHEKSSVPEAVRIPVGFSPGRLR